MDKVATTRRVRTTGKVATTATHKVRTILKVPTMGKDPTTATHRVATTRRVVMVHMDILREATVADMGTHKDHMRPAIHKEATDSVDTDIRKEAIVVAMGTHKDHTLHRIAKDPTTTSRAHTLQHRVQLILEVSSVPRLVLSRISFCILGIEF